MPSSPRRFYRNITEGDTAAARVQVVTHRVDGETAQKAVSLREPIDTLHARADSTPTISLLYRLPPRKHTIPIGFVMGERTIPPCDRKPAELPNRSYVLPCSASSPTQRIGLGPRQGARKVAEL